MCTVLLPPGVNPIAVKYIISYQTLVSGVPDYKVSYRRTQHINFHVQSCKNLTSSVNKIVLSVLFANACQHGTFK
jgi:hypothetical protein